MPSLAGSLLIAHPGLADPNFYRTVLFISHHEPEDGSFGLVLNRPAGRLVSELLPGRDDLGPLGSLPVFKGGPVASDQLIFASFQWNVEARALECRHHVTLEDAIELLHHERVVIRPFIGYAGWGQGQLEGELERHAWLVKPPHSSALDLQQLDRLWRELVASFGPVYRLAAEAPENTSLN